VIFPYEGTREFFFRGLFPFNLRCFIFNIVVYFKTHFVEMSPCLAKNYILSLFGFKGSLSQTRNLNSKLPQGISVIPLAPVSLQDKHLK
jgi:hypothetical protein